MPLKKDNNNFTNKFVIKEIRSDKHRHDQAVSKLKEKQESIKKESGTSSSYIKVLPDTPGGTFTKQKKHITPYDYKMCSVENTSSVDENIMPRTLFRTKAGPEFNAYTPVLSRDLCSDSSKSSISDIVSKQSTKGSISRRKNDKNKHKKIVQETIKKTKHDNQYYDQYDSIDDNAIWSIVHTNYKGVNDNTSSNLSSENNYKLEEQSLDIPRPFIGTNDTSATVKNTIEAFAKTTPSINTKTTEKLKTQSTQTSPSVPLKEKLYSQVNKSITTPVSAVNTETVIPPVPPLKLNYITKASKQTDLETANANKTTVGSSNQRIQNTVYANELEQVLKHIEIGGIDALKEGKGNRLTKIKTIASSVINDSFPPNTTIKKDLENNRNDNTHFHIIQKEISDLQITTKKLLDKVHQVEKSQLNLSSHVEKNAIQTDQLKTLITPNNFGKFDKKEPFNKAMPYDSELYNW